MNDLSNEELKIPKKRPVGRPSAKRPQMPQPKNGIVSAPKDESHHIEFLYDKPIIFKKLMAFFKLMAVDKIHFSFTKENIFIYCKDHHKKNDIRVKIDCSKVNYYYCASDLDIGLLCENPELIMSTIDKTYNTITFLSSEENKFKNIQVILKNDFGFEESHKIDLIAQYDRIDDAQFLDNEYALQFILSGKCFKKMISDIKTFSNQLSIRQDGKDEPLMIEYIKNDKKIKSVNTIRKTDTIKLKSNLDEDSTFRTSVKVDYIRPISNSLLSDNIQINADENKRLLFVVQMDSDIIEMRILTEIIDNRNLG